MSRTSPRVRDKVGEMTAAELRAEADRLDAEAKAAEEARIAEDNAKPENVDKRVTELEARVDYLYSALADVIAYHGPKASTDPNNVGAFATPTPAAGNA